MQFMVIKVLKTTISRFKSGMHGKFRYVSTIPPGYYINTGNLCAVHCISVEVLSSVYQLTCEILCLHAKKTNARNSTAKKYELCDLIHFHLAIRHFVSEYNQG